MDSIFRFVGKEAFLYFAFFINAAAFTLFGMTIAKVSDSKEFLSAAADLGTIAAGIGTLLLAWYGHNAFRIWVSQYRFKDVFEARKKLYNSGEEIIKVVNELIQELDFSDVTDSFDFHENKDKSIKDSQGRLENLYTDYREKWLNINKLLNSRELRFVNYSAKQLEFDIGKIFVLAWDRMREIRNSGNRETQCLVHLHKEFQRVDKSFKSDFIDFWQIAG
ncbi:hypothetical protein L9G74_06340 [Shewanella sp. C32]|uniref:SMODS and SLOG-associating 2TM effector domain-containing protein n=1 Tax=Shewanella electrica TaxID=515560 RepID=A0ABT2FI94_9GAMM|nr:hypothetical protein [Shewanella electrica]MCH1924150.1 hypothetical protein [Shewanella electrica]MCS4556053.1 hypothetical protein [Shewanella electrica]